MAESPDPAASAPKGGFLSSLGAVLAAAWVIGATGASIYGVAAQAWPALPFIRLQALWDDGTYGIFLTFTCTWMATLFPVPIVVMLAWPIVERLQPRNQRPSLTDFDKPDLEMIESNAITAYWLFALVAWGLTAGAVYLLVMRPATFTPIPFLGQITLLLTPIACLASAALFAQAAGRLQVSKARVDALEQETTTQQAPTQQTPEQQTGKDNNEPSVQHMLVHGFRRWQIRPESAARLSVGDRVLIAESPLGTGVLRLARTVRAADIGDTTAGS